jgi:hypothetical protein
VSFGGKKRRGTRKREEIRKGNSKGILKLKGLINHVRKGQKLKQKTA